MVIAALIITYAVEVFYQLSIEKPFIVHPTRLAPPSYIIIYDIKLHSLINKGAYTCVYMIINLHEMG